MTPEREPGSLRSPSGAALPRACARARRAGNREQGREQGAGNVGNSPSTPTQRSVPREPADGGWMRRGIHHPDEIKAWLLSLIDFGWTTANVTSDTRPVVADGARMPAARVARGTQETPNG